MGLEGASPENNGGRKGKEAKRVKKDKVSLRCVKAPFIAGTVSFL